MSFFSGNIRCFFFNSSSRGNSFVSLKNPASFGAPLLAQSYFFYLFYFQRFCNAGFFSVDVLSNSCQQGSLSVSNTRFFFSAVTLATSVSAKIFRAKTFSSFLTKRTFAFINSRTSFCIEVTLRLFPLAFFFDVFEKISFLFMPRLTLSVAVFSGHLFLKPERFTTSDSLAYRIFFLNFSLFWDLVFFSLCGVHNFFYYKLRSFFNVMYLRPVFSVSASFSFWRYFSTFLFLGLPQRFCSLSRVAHTFESSLMSLFLRLLGGVRLIRFNSLIYKVFSSVSFFVFSFLGRFLYTSHFQWLFQSYLKCLSFSWPKRKSLSRKGAVVALKKTGNFFQSAAFQLLFSIQRRGLKVRAFNFIFSFLFFLGCEKAENFELFEQESRITYTFSNTFFNLRLPFQVYNTKLRGKSLQLPILLPRAKSMVLAFKLFIVCVKKRGENGFLSKIFSEFYDLINDNGLSLKQKAVTVRLAFSNKNLLFFRATRFTFGQQRRKKSVIL